MTLRSQLQSAVRNERGFGLVETLIALTILVIGLVAVSGLSLATADQAKIATWRASQATAGHIALEQIQTGGWAAATGGSDTVHVGGHDYLVTLSATNVSSRVREVTAVVAAVGEVDSRTFRTRLYKPKPLPSANPPGGLPGGGGGGGGEDPPDDPEDPPDDPEDPPEDPDCPPGKKKKGEC